MAAPEHTPLLVIGAGPYGLATAAEARRLGIATVVLGEPMGFWRAQHAGRMLLRSGPDWHLDAAGEHTLDAYVEARGSIRDAIDPIPIGVFIGYADWFAAAEGDRAAPGARARPRAPRRRRLRGADGGRLDHRSPTASSPRRASRTSPSSRRGARRGSRPSSGRTPRARSSSPGCAAAAA